MAINPTWNSNVPTGSQLLSQSQPLLNTNNETINSVFNDSIGTFCKILLCQQGSISNVTSPNSAIHSINGSGVTFNNIPIPYFKNSLGDFPLMGDVHLTTPTGQVNYSLQLGNIVINYGTVSGSAATSYNLQFPNSYSSTSSFVVLACYQGTFVTAYSVNFSVTNTAVNTAQINAFNAGTRTFNYIAIGY